MSFSILPPKFVARACGCIYLLGCDQAATPIPCQTMGGLNKQGGR